MPRKKVLPGSLDLCVPQPFYPRSAASAHGGSPAPSALHRGHRRKPAKGEVSAEKAPIPQPAGTSPGPSPELVVPLPVKSWCSSQPTPLLVSLPLGWAQEKRRTALPSATAEPSSVSWNAPKAKAGWRRNHSAMRDRRPRYKSAIVTRNIKTPSNGVFFRCCSPVPILLYFEAFYFIWWIFMFSSHYPL